MATTNGAHAVALARESLKVNHIRQQLIKIKLDTNNELLKLVVMSIAALKSDTGAPVPVAHLLVAHGGTKDEHELLVNASAVAANCESNVG